MLMFYIAFVVTNSKKRLLSLLTLFSQTYWRIYSDAQRSLMLPYEMLKGFFFF